MFVQSNDLCHMTKMVTTLRYEPRCEKTGLRGFRPGNKPGCTAIEDGQGLEISYIGSREIVLSM